MGRLSRPRFRWTLAALITAALIASGAAGIAAPTRTIAAPPQLVGKWTRTISKADTVRAKGLILAAGRKVTFNVPKSGHWTVVIAGLGGLGMVDGTVASAGAGRLRFVLSGEPPALYRWHVAGKTLTLAKIKDAVPDREEVFWGVWKRVP